VSKITVREIHSTDKYVISVSIELITFYILGLHQVSKCKSKGTGLHLEFLELQVQ
jgi:hypothetical protein